MPLLQEISSEEMVEAISLLAEKNSLMSLTVRYQGRWVTFRTHAIASYGGAIWVDMPRTDHLPTPYDFEKGGEVGIAFSVAHRRFVFRAMVLGLETYHVEENVEAAALKLECRDKMRKIERRLHFRLDVSGEEIARAKLWLGGQEVMPEGNDVTAPVWSGRVLNISGGGLLVRASYEAAKYIEVAISSACSPSSTATKSPCPWTLRFGIVRGTARWPSSGFSF